MDVPKAVYEHAFAEIVGARSPAFIRIDGKGRVAESGGGLALYGLSHLTQNVTAAQCIDVLEGLLPLDEPSLLLPCVETDGGIAAEVHIFREDEDHWILLLDASMDKMQERFVQQKEYDVALKEEKQAKLLKRFLDPTLAERLLGKDTERDGVRECFEGSILVTKLSDGDQEPNVDSKTVMDRLQAYHPVLIQSALDEKGVVETITARTVVTIFGLVESNDPPGLRAIRTALRTVKEVEEVAQNAPGHHLERCHVSMAIASGTLALGVMGNKARPSFNVAGPAVDRASSLHLAADAGEILADTATVDGAGQFARLFQTREDGQDVHSCKMLG